MNKKRKLNSKRTGKSKTIVKRFASKNTNKSDQEVLTYYPKIGWRMPMPPRFRTMMVAANSGYQVNGATATGRFEIGLNGLQNPFQTAAAMPNLALPAANDPVGYPNLVDVDFYQKYRVFASKIEVETSVSSGSDQIGIVVIPGEAGFSSGSYFNQIGRPFAKDHIFVSQDDSRKISSKIDIPKLVGVSTLAVKNDMSGTLNGSVGAVPADNYNWHVYWTNVANSAALVGTIAWSVKVYFWVELFELDTELIRR